MWSLKDIAIEGWEGSSMIPMPQKVDTFGMSTSDPYDRGLEIWFRNLFVFSNRLGARNCGLHTSSAILLWPMRIVLFLDFKLFLLCQNSVRLI
jgi:hypothetical protein